jgi:hypothetical protein
VAQVGINRAACAPPPPRAYFERSVAFQKFLMEFSVRPGRRLVIFDQWLPTTAWHWASRNSSSNDQLPLQQQQQQ